jgi:hypothetical protein
MKTFVALAALMMACAVSAPANAGVCGVGCSFTEDISDFAVDPGPAPNPIAASSSLFNQTLFVSVLPPDPGPPFYRSPYENAVPPGSEGPGYGTNPYSSVQAGGTATFNFAPSNALSILWGSPDTYNTLQFWSGLGGTGILLYTITGALLIQTFGHDQVDVSTASVFQSVVLTSELDAFEFAGLSGGCTGGPCAPVDNPVPLPGALPLFVGGLAALGLLTRRRKKPAA